MIFCEARPFQNEDHPDVHPVFRGKQHVHLMGDDERELRLYAGLIGLKATWLQRDAFGIAHFDCTGRFLQIVLQDGAVQKLDRRAFVMAWRALRERAIQAIEESRK